MGSLLQCPRCGTRNKVGQRYCSNCSQVIYYTCTRCNNYVDPSYKYCPVCSTELNWEIKPRVNPASPVKYATSSSGTGYRVLVPVIVAVLILGLLISNYLAYRFSLGSSPVPVGYESYEDHTDTSEPYVMSQPDHQYSGNPPYVKKAGDPIYLINNPDARDISLKELKAFIVSDKTDRDLYIPGLRMCGYFAETLHNYAEQAGIRAAVTIIQFEDGSAPHALNAFHTTDMGLVYIDCTGTRRGPSDFEEWAYKLFYPVGQDRMAYIKKGKEYGTILLEDAESVEYSYYTGFVKSWVRDEHFFFSRPGIVKSVVVYW